MNEKQMSFEGVCSRIKRIHTELEELEKALNEDMLETGEKWTFPKDNYTVLAIWLLHDPKSRRMFPVNERKSWGELAEKLTKYVEWTVDEHILRQNYTRKYLRYSKKEQNAL